MSVRRVFVGQILERLIEHQAIPDIAAVDQLGPRHAAVSDQLVEQTGRHANVARSGLARQPARREERREHPLVRTGPRPAVPDRLNRRAVDTVFLHELGVRRVRAADF